MALAVPSTQQIADNIVSQIEGSIQQTIPLLPKAFTRVLAKALAGVFVLLYRYAGWMFLQIFVAHASFEETIVGGRRIRPLVEWGRLVGEADPFPATRAELMVSVPVTTQTGSLSARAQLLRSETGVIYEVVAAVPLNAATVTVKIRAVSDLEGNDGAGTVGNLEAGAKLTFANPRPNVGTEVTVLSTAVLGGEAEGAEAYRARVLKRFRRKPKGGAPAHFVEWGETADGAIAIYPYKGAPGEVDLFVEANGNVDGIPTSPQLDAVKVAVEGEENGLASRRPAGTFVNVLPIRRTGFTVVVYALEPNTPAMLALLEQGLDEYFRSREPFILGITSLPRTDRITDAAVSGVVDTIVNAAGGSVARIELREGVIPFTVRELRKGEKSKLAQLIPVAGVV